MPKPTRRKSIPPGIRYEVLALANFRCQACGVAAKEARLEIDHKIPVAQGGSNDLNNLEVLCRSCNRGKGARFIKTGGQVNKITKTKPKSRQNLNKAQPRKTKPKLNKPKKQGGRKLNKKKAQGFCINLIKTRISQILLRISLALRQVNIYLDLER